MLAERTLTCNAIAMARFRALMLLNTPSMNSSDAVPSSTCILRRFPPYTVDPCARRDRASVSDEHGDSGARIREELDATSRDTRWARRLALFVSGPKLASGLESTGVTAATFAAMRYS